jgi:hypothetical protein
MRLQFFKLLRCSYTRNAFLHYVHLFVSKVLKFAAENSHMAYIVVYLFKLNKMAKVITVKYDLTLL